MSGSDAGSGYKSVKLKLTLRPPQASPSPAASATVPPENNDQSVRVAPDVNGTSGANGTKHGGISGSKSARVWSDAPDRLPQYTDPPATPALPIPDVATQMALLSAANSALQGVLASNIFKRAEETLQRSATASAKRRRRQRESGSDGSGSGGEDDDGDDEDDSDASSEAGFLILPGKRPGQHTHKPHPLLHTLMAEPQLRPPKQKRGQDAFDAVAALAGKASSSEAGAGAQHAAVGSNTTGRAALQHALRASTGPAVACHDCARARRRALRALIRGVGVGAGAGSSNDGTDNDDGDKDIREIIDSGTRRGILADCELLMGLRALPWRAPAPATPAIVAESDSNGSAQAELLAASPSCDLAKLGRHWLARKATVAVNRAQRVVSVLVPDPAAFRKEYTLQQQPLLPAGAAAASAAVDAAGRSSGRKRKAVRPLNVGEADEEPQHLTDPKRRGKKRCAKSAAAGAAPEPSGGATTPEGGGGDTETGADSDGDGGSIVTPSHSPSPVAGISAAKSSNGNTVEEDAMPAAMNHAHSNGVTSHPDEHHPASDGHPVAVPSAVAIVSSIEGVTGGIDGNSSGRTSTGAADGTELISAPVAAPQVASSAVSVREQARPADSDPEAPVSGRGRGGGKQLSMTSVATGMPKPIDSAGWRITLVPVSSLMPFAEVVEAVAAEMPEDDEIGADVATVALTPQSTPSSAPPSTSGEKQQPRRTARRAAASLAGGAAGDGPFTADDAVAAMLRCAYAAPHSVADVPGRGRCVYSAGAIPRGAFVCEYAGQLITGDEAAEREAAYHERSLGSYMFYFTHDHALASASSGVGSGSQLGTHAVATKHCVDATAERAKEYGIGRLVSHSRKLPNLEVRKAVVDGVPRLAMVARRDVLYGEELAYDYGEKDKAAIAAFSWLATT